MFRYVRPLPEGSPQKARGEHKFAEMWNTKVGPNPASKCPMKIALFLAWGAVFRCPELAQVWNHFGARSGAESVPQVFVFCSHLWSGGGNRGFGATGIRGHSYVIVFPSMGGMFRHVRPLPEAREACKRHAGNTNSQKCGTQKWDRIRPQNVQ